MVFTGGAVSTAPNAAGCKDTVQVPLGTVTWVIMRFADYTGSYVWHCHILEHEDNAMMRPYVVK